jgi:hypothetical protein
VKTFIERQRYILPPVKNIRRIMKSSSFKDKNDEIINSYMEKELANYVTPLKKKTGKEYNSASMMEGEL